MIPDKIEPWKWNLAIDGLVRFYNFSIAPGHQPEIDNVEKITVEDLDELIYNEPPAIWT